MKMTDQAIGILNKWLLVGAPVEWDVFPILADALEDGGYDNRGILDQLRDGKLSTVDPYRGKVDQITLMRAIPQWVPINPRAL